MRKISFLLVLCLLLCCFAACNNDQTDDGEPTDTVTFQETTQATEDTSEEPTDTEETKAPEIPQSDWTERY